MQALYCWFENKHAKAKGKRASKIKGVSVEKDGTGMAPRRERRKSISLFDISMARMEGPRLGGGGPVLSSLTICA